MDFVIDLQNGHHLFITEQSSSGEMIITSDLFKDINTGEFDAILDAITYMIKAQYRAGINIRSEAYVTALIETVNAMVASYGE